MLQVGEAEGSVCFTRSDQNVAHPYINQGAVETSYFSSSRVSREVTASCSFPMLGMRAKFFKIQLHIGKCYAFWV